MTRKRRRQMLNRAGRDMASANSSVRIPRAPFTSLRTRPTFTTRTTRSRVGEKKYLAIKSFSTIPNRNLGGEEETSCDKSLVKE